jgi:hypothetical protein
MHFRHLLLGMLGAALSFACGSEEPLVTVNQSLVLIRSDGVREPIGDSCAEVQRGHDYTAGSPNPSELTFYKIASRAPDLEVAQAWHGQYLVVAARIAGTSNQRVRSLSFDYLQSHSHDTLLLNRATAADGAYELQTWGGDPRSSDRGCHLYQQG